MVEIMVIKNRTITSSTIFPNGAGVVDIYNSFSSNMINITHY